MNNELKFVNVRDYAIAKHGDQKYGVHHYVRHLDDVYSVLLENKFATENLITLAYLHDVVEDTKTSLEEIKDTFGEHIADCVKILTDETGVNRKERKQKTNLKLSKVEGQLQDALIVKAADRLANLRTSVQEKSDKLEMYRKEHADFRASAYRENLCDSIWNEIEKIIQ